jgi:hypothetical protein
LQAMLKNDNRLERQLCGGPGCVDSGTVELPSQL